MATYINPQNCKDCAFCDKTLELCTFRDEPLEDITIDDTLMCIYADPELVEAAFQAFTEIWEADSEFYMALKRWDAGRAEASFDTAVSDVLENLDKKTIMALVKFVSIVHENAHPLLNKVICNGLGRFTMELTNPSNSNRTTDDVEGG